MAEGNSRGDSGNGKRLTKLAKYSWDKVIKTMNNGITIKTELLGVLANEINVCNRCELKAFGGKPFVGTGNLNAKLFLIGEAPTSYAERQREPLVGGTTGEVINKWLNYIGLNREEVYLTNAVKCVLRKETGKSRQDGLGPSRSEPAQCKFWLTKEMEIINPAVILTVGWAATESVSRKTVS